MNLFYAGLQLLLVAAFKHNIMLHIAAYENNSDMLFLTLTVFFLIKSCFDTIEYNRTTIDL